MGVANGQLRTESRAAVPAAVRRASLRLRSGQALPAAPEGETPSHPSKPKPGLPGPRLGQPARCYSLPRRHDHRHDQATPTDFISMPATPTGWPGASMPMIADQQRPAGIEDAVAPAAFGSSAPYTRRRTRAWTAAPAHIAQGSIVANSSQSPSR